MSSWREAAGRVDGETGYKFGDVSRTLVKRLTSKGTDAATPKPSWRETAGRSEGDDGYVFGDVSRTIVKKVVAKGDEHEERAAMLRRVFERGHDTASVLAAAATGGGTGGGRSSGGDERFGRAVRDALRGNHRICVDISCSHEMTLWLANACVNRCEDGVVFVADPDPLRLAATVTCAHAAKTASCVHAACKPIMEWLEERVDAHADRIDVLALPTDDEGAVSAAKFCLSRDLLGPGATVLFAGPTQGGAFAAYVDKAPTLRSGAALASPPSDPDSPEDDAPPPLFVATYLGKRSDAYI